MQKKYFYKKFRKKNKSILNIQKNNYIGFYQLRSLEKIFLKNINIESIRRLLARKIKKKIIFIFFKNINKLPIFIKPLKVRMGSGIGAFNIWIWKFKKFQKIFEISFFNKYYLIKKFLNKIKKKLPCKSFITKRV